METWLGRWGKAGEGVSVGKKGGFERRDLRARRWREDPPAAPRILRGPGGRGSARARGCGRVSTSSRVSRLRLRLARVFSPAVSVRVACVWRAGGGEARRVSSRRGGGWVRCGGACGGALALCAWGGGTNHRNDANEEPRGSVCRHRGWATCSHPCRPRLFYY